MMHKEIVKSHQDLALYQTAFDAAMKIFELSKEFPQEEQEALTAQLRRSSRSVCASLAQAWRKRHHEASCLAQLNECEAEAAQTQAWIEFAVKCNYLDLDAGRELYLTYSQVLGNLVNMINNVTVSLLGI